MKLYPPSLFSLYMICGCADILGGTDDVIILRQAGDCVTMAHPYLCRGGNAEHEGVFRRDYSKHRAAVFA